METVMITEDWTREIDQSHSIIRAANIAALAECRNKGLSCAAAYIALMQECMENYARLQNSDHEAIRQIREFLDEWEAEAGDQHPH
jgi:hypothetical protein